MVLHMSLSVLLLFSTIAYAEDVGKFTILSQNEIAPFEGVLFDPIATADIIVARSFTSEDCEIKINHEIDKKEAEFTIERETLNIRYKSLRDEYRLITEQKDLEIVQLKESLLKQSPNNNWWWVTGGAVVGTALTYGAYKVFNE
jgi:hypothetical protein